jgi:flagellin
MGLTVNNQNTLTLLNILGRTTADQSQTLTRLSTGRNINRGADDPAGLIALQSLSAELTAVDAAIGNGQRATSVLNTADGALAEISSLLNEIESLAAQSTSSGGLSPAEIAANQAQIDNALGAINRIVQTTQFNGKRLLDGSQSIRAAASDTDVTDLKIYSRPSSATSQSFSVNVISAAARASAVVATSAGAITASEFTVAGRLGTATITASNTDELDDIRDKIIAAAGQTGVSAYVTGTSLVLQSRDFGENAFVSASRISGDTEVVNVSHTTGTDATVTVNGQQAFVDGLNVSFNSNGTSGSFTLGTGGNVANSSQGSLSITDGGATFQLGTTADTQATVGINALFTHTLGDSVTGYLNTLRSGGTNDLSTNANNAVAIARAAMGQIATQQGRIGGFQKFQVETSINSLNATKEALSAARGVINDVDYATATADLSRQNVLLQSAISLLGVAGQQSSQVLSLLR